ncbi:MAG: S24/S26 family peptidase, partial [Candidatus Omnitrophota bacterium]
MEEKNFSSQDYAGLLGAILTRKAEVRFKANGFSMSPFIKDGDIITVSPLNDLSPRVGDIVAFNNEKTCKLAVHRIVARKTGDGVPYFFIKGDNVARGAFEGGPLKNILGRVTRIERRGRRVSAGLGPERRLIAFLSRTRILSVLFLPWRFLSAY